MMHSILNHSSAWFLGGCAVGGVIGFVLGIVCTQAVARGAQSVHCGPMRGAA